MLGSELKELSRLVNLGFEGSTNIMSIIILHTLNHTLFVEGGRFVRASGFGALHWLREDRSAKPFWEFRYSFRV